ncbi:MAG: DUF4292 domain-containing protein [Flavobacteriales bacterium]|nr:DUF4292 domain-containing protein [Flavobacteriales bacterium]
MRLLLPVLCATLLFSCKAKDVVSGSALPALTAQEILARSALNRQFGEMSSKVNISYKVGEQGQSFSARVRMKQDSIIWVSIAPMLGIEMVRAVITPDSLKLLDRFGKRFYIGPFDRLDQLLGVDLNFAMLQALITGNNIDLYAMERYESRPDAVMYMVQVATPTRREQRKGANMVSINQQTWLEPQHFTVARSLVVAADTGSSLDATYRNPMPMGKVHFPERMAFRIEGRQQAQVDMQWFRPQSASGQDFPFSVPEGYDAIK